MPEYGFLWSIVFCTRIESSSILSKYEKTRVTKNPCSVMFYTMELFYHVRHSRSRDESVIIRDIFPDHVLNIRN